MLPRRSAMMIPPRASWEIHVGGMWSVDAVAMIWSNDLQNTMSGLKIESLEHPGHDRGHRAGAGRSAHSINKVRRRGQLNRDNVVCVDAAEPLVTLRGIGPVHHHLLATLRPTVEARNEHLPRRVLEGSAQPGAAHGVTGD